MANTSMVPGDVEQRLHALGVGGGVEVTGDEGRGVCYRADDVGDLGQVADVGRLEVVRVDIDHAPRRRPGADRRVEHDPLLGRALGIQPHAPCGGERQSREHGHPKLAAVIRQRRGKRVGVALRVGDGAWLVDLVRAPCADLDLLHDEDVSVELAQHIVHGVDRRAPRCADVPAHDAYAWGRGGTRVTRRERGHDKRPLPVVDRRGAAHGGREAHAGGGGADGPKHNPV